MSASIQYIVDTSSLINLRQYYPADMFPNVWDKLSQLAQYGILASSSEVYRELSAQEDDVVFTWAKQQKHIFLPPIAAIQQNVTEILRTHGNLLDVKRQKSGADPFVLATAMNYNCTVVSEERLAELNSRVTRLPNVCNAYNIPCIPLLEMLRNQGFSQR